MTALEDRPPVVDRPPPDPEVLIEEARRRQRRRHASLAGLAAALALAAAIYGLTSGGGSPKAPAPTARGGGSTHRLTASWRELSAADAYFPPGATVTDVARWRGRLYATGQLVSPARLSGLGCRVGCAVVWTSKGGRAWRAVFAARPMGGGDGEWLLPMRHQLLMFDSDEFSALWRSTNGRAWRQVKLPVELSGGEVGGEVSPDGLRATVVGNGVSLPAAQHGRAELRWTSTDGVQWRPAPRARTAPLRLPHPWKDAVRDLVVGNHVTVLQLAPPPIGPSARTQLWYSVSGRSWARASVQGRLPIAGGMRYAPSTSPQVLAVPGGFVDYDSSNTRLWWSPSGRAWSRLRVNGAPPAIFSPDPDGPAEYVVGDSLIVAEQAQRAGDGVPRDATTIWQLELPDATASS